jgi:O-acetylhomoserine (thiol)-lyase
MTEWGFETRAIHAGKDLAREWGSTNGPLHQTAAFSHPGAEEMEEVFAGRRAGYTYSRIANPTVGVFEQRMAAVEGGVGALAASSGMAAIATVLFTLTRQGDRVVAGSSLFGGTLALFDRVFRRYGVEAVTVDSGDLAAVRAAINDRTRLLFVEMIGNPRLDVPDVEALAAVAAERQVPLVVDSTLATPYLFRPREHGAAIVVHSSTKYITGNGSAIGGVLVDLGTFDWSTQADQDLREAARKVGPQLAFLATARRVVQQNTGSSQSPMNAWLHAAGLETLALRMERHCSNALALARALAARPGVEAVSYPGLETSPWHQAARRQFGGRYGGLLTLRLGSRERCFKACRALRLARNAANLGDVRTLVIHPASTIYRETDEKARLAAGVTDDLLRVSVGIETAADILEDFSEAVAAAG